MMKFIGQFRRRLSRQKIEEYKMLASQGDMRAKELLSGRGNLDRSLDNLRELRATQAILPHLMRGIDFATKSHLHPFDPSNKPFDNSKIRGIDIHDGNHSLLPSNIGAILVKTNAISALPSPQFLRHWRRDAGVSKANQSEGLQNYLQDYAKSNTNKLNYNFSPPEGRDVISGIDEMYDSDGKKLAGTHIRRTGQYLNYLQELILAIMEGVELPNDSSFEDKVLKLITAENWQEDLDKLKMIAKKITKYRPKKLYGDSAGKIISRIVRNTPLVGTRSIDELTVGRNK